MIHLHQLINKNVIAKNSFCVQTKNRNPFKNTEENLNRFQKINRNIFSLL